MRRIDFYQSLVNCHQAALPHISIKKCRLLAINRRELQPGVLLAFFTELNGSRQGEIAEVKQTIVIERGRRFRQEGVTDNPEADLAIQRIAAREGGDGSQQVSRQLMQVGDVALWHHIEHVSFTQVIDTAILRGQGVHIGTEGLLDFSAGLIAVALQRIDQERHRNSR